MIQTLLSILTFFGFAPAAPRAAGVGPGPTGRRRALYETPRPRVAQPAAARELAHEMGIQTKGFARSIPAGRAVRWLQNEARCTPSDVGLFNVTRHEVELSLGPDLLAYVELCLRERQPIPAVSPSLEHANDALYRVKLTRSMQDDVELWESAARTRDRQRAEAQEAGIAQPPALRIPNAVEIVIAQRAAAALASLKRRKETQGGSTGKAGSNVIQFPADDQSPPPDVPSVPGLK